MLRGVARSGCDASFCCCRFSQGVATRRSGMLRSMSAMLCGAAGKSVSLCLFCRARRTAVGHNRDLIGQTAPASMAGIRIKQGILRMATILRRIFCGARLRCAWRRGAVAGEACDRTAALPGRPVASIDPLRGSCARIAEGAALSARRRFSKSLSFPKVFHGGLLKNGQRVHDMGIDRCG